MLTISTVESEFKLMISQAKSEQNLTISGVWNKVGCKYR